MRFQLVPPLLPVPMFGPGQWYIFAEGPIDHGAAERLQDLVHRNQVQRPAVIYLHSNGGNPMAAMELGRTIRSNGMWTRIGRIPTPDGPAWESGTISIPGACLSACVLSFSGGVYRFLARDDESVYGVHRVWSPVATGMDLDIGQIISSSIVNYVEEMGIDSGLFELMASTPGQEILFPEWETLLELSAINNGALPPDWTVQLNDQILYVRGQQQTIHGLNKANFYCDNGNFLLMPMVDVFTQQNAESYIDWVISERLIIEGEALVQNSRESSLIFPTNNYIASVIVLNEMWIEDILRSERIGYQLLIPNPDIYLGFNIELNEEGHQLLRGLVHQCRL